MEIVKLPVGEKAPPDSDCISLRNLPDGKVRLEASALIACADGDADESISLVDGGAYDSMDDAESAGLAWADGHGVRQVYVSTDA